MGFEVEANDKANVKIYGKVYACRRPTVKDLTIVAKKTKGSSELESIDVMVDFMSELGIPRDVLEDMEPDHFASLVEHFTTPKKK